MKNFENINTPEVDKKESGGMTRREFLKSLGAAGAAVLCARVEGALALDDDEGELMPSRYENRWFYSLEEMGRVYEEEYNSDEKLLENILYKKEDKWFGAIEGEEVEVSSEFINKTLEHLKSMLEQKAARFLFSLDAFHGHLFVREEAHESRYTSQNAVGQLRTIVGDSDVGVLFHNFEHLQADTDNREATELYNKRNVVGRYDGSPIEILPLPKTLKKRTAHATPGRDLLPFLKFAAHKNGEFSIEVDGKTIHLDISFDDPTYY